MTPSEERVERYRRIEREADAFGRLIGVKLLKVSEQIKIEEMTPALEGMTTIDKPDGGTFKIPRRSLPMAAASVREIDNIPIPFPRTRGELDAIMDQLDAEGLSAAALAFSKLSPAPVDAGGETLSAEDAAKKS